MVGWGGPSPWGESERLQLGRMAKAVYLKSGPAKMQLPTRKKLRRSQKMNVLPLKTGCVPKIGFRGNKTEIVIFSNGGDRKVTFTFREFRETLKKTI